MLRHSTVRRLLLPAAAAALAACGGGDAASDTATAADSAAISPMAEPAPTPAAGGMLDPDVATRDDLMGVPGMTAAVADSIVARRPYASMLALDSLLTRAQLGEAARDSVYARVWKPIDLNTASDEEILLIPNLGNRMLREFKEYRPYTSMEQFRREMGKYVDEEEVARLERYVMIPGA
jgi:DNA uptake protein ComE-like DNA-binding protein